MDSSDTKTPYSIEDEAIASERVGPQDEDHNIDKYGYKPELCRRFGIWSTIGLSCTIMITWEGWLPLAGVSLMSGGKAGCVYSFLYVWLGYTAVNASLGELMSMIPTAAGQYHWTYELAPAKYRKFVSWITGWQLILAWQAGVAAALYIASLVIQSLAVLNYPEYEFHRWHGTMIAWALILLIIFFNTVLVKMLPYLEGGILAIHILSFFAVLVPLVYYGPHTSASDVFENFQTFSGYDRGTSWFVGMISIVFAFLGADGAIHMAEEVCNSRINVPRGLMFGVTINGILGFGILLTVMFTIGDVAEALDTKTGFVFLDYFARVLHSDASATAITSVIMVLYISCIIAILASASRVTWAFARDNGLPGSTWLKKVSTSYKLPLASIALTGSISFLLSLINIGSAVAFNAVLSLVVASFFGSYIVPIAIIAWMRITNQRLELGPWNLGRWGLLINIVSLIWLTIAWVFSFFPVAIPVAPDTMNWSCVIWGTTMMFGVVWYWLYQRHRFNGPKVVMGSMDIH